MPLARATNSLYLSFAWLAPQLLKSLGVKAIPTIVVYSPDGVRLVEFGAGVKKLDTLRVNMAALISHKGQPVALDPNGLVVVKA